MMHSWPLNKLFSRTHIQELAQEIMKLVCSLLCCMYVSAQFGNKCTCSFFFPHWKKDFPNLLLMYDSICVYEQ